MPLIVGRQPVLEALKSKNFVEKVYILFGARGNQINQIRFLAKKRKAKIVILSKQKFRELTPSTATQGVAALVGEREYNDIDDILKVAEERNEKPFILLLENIQDPRNLGALIRTAECMGVHGIILPKDRSASINQDTVKASAGAIEHMPIAKITNVSQTIDELKSKGLWIVGTSSKADKILTEFDFNIPLVLIFGQEGQGMRRLTEEKCDFLVKIPLFGKVESLNVSVACGMFLYEIRRQKSMIQKAETEQVKAED
ncbi:MAG: 23S rRNA (guanosine(2251)-2'-O)-methyltransferase RlmB [Ignavibacteria bacterium]